MSKKNTPRDGKLEITTIDVQIDNFLKGEILTLIDSAIENERQCKALKDSIHLAFKRKRLHLHELSNMNSNEYAVTAEQIAD